MTNWTEVTRSLRRLQRQSDVDSLTRRAAVDLRRSRSGRWSDAKLLALLELLSFGVRQQQRSARRSARTTARQKLAREIAREVAKEQRRRKA